MKLFLKRDISSFDSLFTVLDDKCSDKYYVRRVKNIIELRDLRGKPLLKIRSLPFPALRAYSMSTVGRSAKLMINPKSRCYYYGLSWHIRGDILTKSFDIIDADNSLVATHCKRFCDSGDGFELNIENEAAELFCIGTAVCVNLGVTADKRILQTV